MSAQVPLTEPFRIGGVEIANRVLLAPLAGIGNWFVRLQARRHGAGLAVSEMVSSHAIHYGNERTLNELLRIHPDEHPTAIQLFGADPGVMRGAAAVVAETGADLIDLNMGCPVKKVRKTGAGAELISDPDLAVAVAAAAVEGGGGRPVTVKLRSGLDRATAVASPSPSASSRRPGWRRSPSIRARPPSSTRARPTTRWCGS